MTDAAGEKREIGKHTGSTPDARRAKKGEQTFTNNLPSAPPLPNATVDVPQNDILEFLRQDRLDRQEEFKKLHSQHTEMISSIEGLKVTTTQLQTAIEVERTTREKEIADLKVKVSEVEKLGTQDMIKKEVAKALESSHSGKSKTNTDIDDVELRKRQVVVSGLGEFEEAKDMVAMLDEILKKIMGANHGLQMSSVGRGSKLGIITFPSTAAKVDFYKRAENHADVSDDIHFFNNRTFEERVADKKLGLLKHLMVSSGKFPTGEIKILWPQRIVALGRKRVAWFEGNTFFVSKSAKPFETEMQTRLKSWIEKRTPELDTESE